MDPLTTNNAIYRDSLTLRANLFANYIFRKFNYFLGKGDFTWVHFFTCVHILVYILTLHLSIRKKKQQSKLQTGERPPQFV